MEELEIKMIQVYESDVVQMDQLVEQLFDIELIDENLELQFDTQQIEKVNELHYELPLILIYFELQLDFQQIDENIE